MWMRAELCHKLCRQMNTAFSALGVSRAARTQFNPLAKMGPFNKGRVAAAVQLNLVDLASSFLERLALHLV
jgi:hypothetical protein